jgi:hypothetical protein
MRPTPIATFVTKTSVNHETTCENSHRRVFVAKYTTDAGAEKARIIYRTNTQPSGICAKPTRLVIA